MLCHRTQNFKKIHFKNYTGENCHRGAALGALLGAAASRRGKKIPAILRDNLNSMKVAANDAAVGMNKL